VGSREIDIIRPLDEAFRVDDLDGPAWISRVSAALVPLFDEGLGTFAWLVRSGRTCVPTFDGMVMADAPSRYLDSMQGLHREARPEDYVTAYPRTAAGIHTLATLFGSEQYRSSPLLRRWMHDRQVPDPAALHVKLVGRRLLVGGFLRHPGVLTPVGRRLGARLGLRIAQAFRVRQALARGISAPVAIVTPGGRVVHAVGPATSTERRSGLRQAVRARERARSSLRRRDPEAAFDLFRGLVDGKFTIVDRFESDGRRYLVAYENPGGIAALRALTARERQILDRAARGDSLKSIAIELGLTPSAAAAYLAGARRKTGLRSRAELVRWFHRGADS
jgi:DNA-binding CsgD family transcriptional regulator